jgi:hypothetical protein
MKETIMQRAALGFPVVIITGIKPRTHWWAEHIDSMVKYEMNDWEL